MASLSRQEQLEGYYKICTPSQDTDGTPVINIRKIHFNNPEELAKGAEIIQVDRMKKVEDLGKSRS